MLPSMAAAAPALGVGALGTGSPMETEFFCEDCAGAEGAATWGEESSEEPIWAEALLAPHSSTIATAIRHAAGKTKLRLPRKVRQLSAGPAGDPEHNNLQL